MNHVIHGLRIAKEREVLLKKAKRCMVYFWDEKGTSRHKLLITNVTIRLGKEEHVLTVTLERPGLLIGKGGRDINALQEKLTKELEHPTKIHLIEDKQWMGIYVGESF